MLQHINVIPQKDQKSLSFILIYYFQTINIVSHRLKSNQ